MLRACPLSWRATRLPLMTSASAPIVPDAFRAAPRCEKVQPHRQAARHPSCPLPSHTNRLFRNPVPPAKRPRDSRPSLPLRRRKPLPARASDPRVSLQPSGADPPRALHAHHHVRHHATKLDFDDFAFQAIASGECHAKKHTPRLWACLELMVLARELPDRNRVDAPASLR